MPSGTQNTVRRSQQNPRRHRKRRRRGPLIRFRFGMLCFIWLASLIVCFGLYMYHRNVHPERDVFVSKAVAETSSALDSVAPVDSAPEESSVTEQVNSTASDESSAEESSQAVIEAKINPVPDGQTPQPASYLEKCAFVGDMLVDRLYESGLLQKKNSYSSETLTLDNYRTEYIRLQDGTTIRILSAVARAKCPIYLMFGTESLVNGRKPDQMTAQFSEMLNSVVAGAPAAQVYVLSIPPVTAAAEKLKKGAVLNSDIDLYNSNLLELCNQANVYFVDTNTALKNSSGKLDPAYAEQDGIHLNKDAGELLLNYVLAHVPNA